MGVKKKCFLIQMADTSFHTRYSDEYADDAFSMLISRSIHPPLSSASITNLFRRKKRRRGDEFFYSPVFSPFFFFFAFHSFTRLSFLRAILPWHLRKRTFGRRGRGRVFCETGSRLALLGCIFTCRHFICSKVRIF